MDHIPWPCSWMADIDVVVVDDHTQLAPVSLKSLSCPKIVKNYLLCGFLIQPSYFHGVLMSRHGHGGRVEGYHVIQLELPILNVSVHRLQDFLTRNAVGKFIFGHEDVWN